MPRRNARKGAHRVPSLQRPGAVTAPNIVERALTRHAASIGQAAPQTGGTPGAGRRPGAPSTFDRPGSQWLPTA